ncbi:ATP-binding cassette domain-containing protein [Streptomyces sp. MRC013]|uniref:ATP-binding cassette domain-containing protein n=1 Tax=Streptomyces sp. MRC013 TaxID=2898276 RepID=UPI0020266551|nr:ATP-binding cassette domain-containing protein [Streptomyces sp. MRC013]URM91003.1 ATP-binding cassette domain-containing protein [Streptomyces sp. MRC013]
MADRPDAGAVPAGPAVEAEGLVKAFGAHRAVDGLDLTVPAGTVYGLLGPNGAGKTTTVRTLATLVRPDGGRARVFGRDVVREAGAVRGLIGLTGQYASLDEDLTGAENLVLLGRLAGLPKRSARDRADRVLEAFALAGAAGRRVGGYSGGMRRRLDIAASLLAAPALLFLDEPTTGLDPRSRGQVWDVVRAIVDLGTTVLLTTQYLDEADRLASRIAVVDRGRVVAEGTQGELKASVGAGSVHLRLADPGQRAEAERVLALHLAAEVRREADPAALTARVGGAGGGRDAAERASRVLAELARRGIAVDAFSLGRPSLDEVFLALTGREADAGAAPADAGAAA